MLIYLEKMGRGVHQVPGYISIEKIVSIRQCPVDVNITDIYMTDGTFVSVPFALQQFITRYAEVLPVII